MNHTLEDVGSPLLSRCGDHSSDDVKSLLEAVMNAGIVTVVLSDLMKSISSSWE